MIFISWT